MYNNQTSVTITIGIILGLLCLISVQQHWVSSVFSYLMSFVTEDFSMKITSYIPDLLILTAFLLMIVGVIHLLQFYMVATLIGVIAIASITGYYKYDMSKSHKPAETTIISSQSNNN